MSDDSPFDDFSGSPSTLDPDQPIALPPPDEYVEQQYEQASQPQEDDEPLASPPDDPFATVDGGSTSNAGAFDSFSNQAEVKDAEEGPLRAWEVSRAAVLRERSAQAEASKQELLSSAKQDVQKFYADRDAQFQKSQKTNRGDEKNYRADMKSTFETGTKWEKVNKLVSLAPRPTEKGQVVSRVERMRKLLLQLKTSKDGK